MYKKLVFKRFSPFFILLNAAGVMLESLSFSVICENKAENEIIIIDPSVKLNKTCSASNAYAQPTKYIIGDSMNYLL